MTYTPTLSSPVPLSAGRRPFRPEGGGRVHMTYFHTFDMYGERHAVVARLAGVCSGVQRLGRPDDQPSHGALRPQDDVVTGLHLTAVL